MISTELFKKIKKIQISTSHLVTDSVCGSYESAFKGQGMNFEEVREYTLGDDVRNIDWNVSARMQSTYVKIFREERELTIMLLIDLSSSGKFGSCLKTKNEIASEVASILACTAIKNNDKVGMIIFTNQIEKFIPPKKGKAHIWRLIKEIISFKPKYRGTNISNALEFLMSCINKKSVSFLISDFIDDGYERALKVATKKHDLIALSITDPREYILPKVGLLELRDSETGEFILINTNKEKNRVKYENFMKIERQKKLSLFRKLNVDNIEIFTDKAFIDSLIKFFQRRGSRQK